MCVRVRHSVRKCRLPPSVKAVDFRLEIPCFEELEPAYPARRHLNYQVSRLSSLPAGSEADSRSCLREVVEHARIARKEMAMKSSEGAGKRGVPAGAPRPR